MRCAYGCSGNVALTSLFRKRVLPPGTPILNYRAQLEELAKKKIQDTTAASLEACMSTIAGTARSMGVTVSN